MPSFKCPRCAARIALASSEPATVVCEECGAKLKFPGSPPPAAPPPVAANPGPGRASVWEDDDEEEPAAGGFLGDSRSVDQSDDEFDDDAPSGKEWDEPGADADGSADDWDDSFDDEPAAPATLPPRRTPEKRLPPKQVASKQASPKRSRGEGSTALEPPRPRRKPQKSGVELPGWLPIAGAVAGVAALIGAGIWLFSGGGAGVGGPAGDRVAGTGRLAVHIASDDGSGRFVFAEVIPVAPAAPEPAGMPAPIVTAEPHFSPADPPGHAGAADPQVIEGPTPVSERPPGSAIGAGDLTPDRSQVVTVPPEPPAAPGPIPRTEPRPIAEILVQPTVVAVSDTRVATFDFDLGYPPSGDARPPEGERALRVGWRRFDRQTGEPLGPAVTLTRTGEPALSVEFREQGKYAEYPHMRAALTADGARLAAIDGEAPDRVDVWKEPGEHLVGFVPSEARFPVEAVGWSADDRLVTSAGGVVTIWDLSGDAPRALIEVPGDYAGRFDVDPSRTYVAAGTRAGGIDLLELATGRCPARCATGSARHPIETVAISPDGQRVVAVTVAVEDLPEEEPAAGVPDRGRPDPPRIWLSWQPTTGEVFVTKPTTGHAGLSWTGPEQIAMANGNAARLGAAPGLFDVKLGRRLGTIWQPRAWDPPPDPAATLNASPRGGVPFKLELGADLTRQYRETWGPAKATQDRNILLLPAVRLAAGVPSGPPDRAFVARADRPLTLDVDLGSKSVSEECARNLAKKLHEQGYPIGPGGWTYEVRYKVGSQGEEMRVGLSVETVPIVPVVHRLLTEAGAQVAGDQTDYHFKPEKTRFMVAAEESPDQPAPASGMVEYNVYYEFPAGMHDSVVGELLENAAADPQPLDAPAAFVGAGETWIGLPVDVRLPD